MKFILNKVGGHPMSSNGLLQGLGRACSKQSSTRSWPRNMSRQVPMIPRIWADKGWAREMPKEKQVLLLPYIKRHLR